MYLESIFIGAEDIRLQLPDEAKRFDKIDKVFKDVMTQTFKQPNVVEACNADNRLEMLHDLSERLDKVQKSLTDYLDTKRKTSLENRLLLAQQRALGRPAEFTRLRQRHSQTDARVRGAKTDSRNHRTTHQATTWTRNTILQNQLYQAFIKI